MDHVAQLLLELGLLFAGLSLLGLLARRLGLSSVPFVLVAALALGEGGVVPLAASVRLSPPPQPMFMAVWISGPA